MAEVKFMVTVQVPDEKLDPKNRIIGSEEWGPASRSENDNVRWAKEGVPRWEDGEREPLEHYARRLLVVYCPSDHVRVSDVKLKK